VHDLVIDNAVVIDGLGGPARPGGTAIDGGRITAVGQDLGSARCWLRESSTSTPTTTLS